MGLDASLKIAICNDIYEFGGNRLANQYWSSKFPGAGWVSEFYKLTKARGWEVASGEIAYSNVKSGYWNAKQVLVIQELNSFWGKSLIGEGATPFLQTCFESPLYAWPFFDKFNKEKIAFENYMMPLSGDHEKVIVGEKFQLCFPSYWSNDILSPKSWGDRKYLVLVAANKYWANNPPPSLVNVRSFFRWIKWTFLRMISPTLNLNKINQLHDERLGAIEYFSKMGKLDIYGSGWTQLSILPKEWRERLNKIELFAKGKIQNKIIAQSEYKYALCFENVRYPGYVTEKIIECYVAGVIPLYLGAPDINSFVPRDSFIDLRNFASYFELDNFLKNLSEDDAYEMISRGQKFLASNLGVMHSHEGYANWVVDNIESYSA